ncbi:MAG: flippase-like domain-containing protein [Elusimicrobia bacterium]|nr:flippase-like domain-containing protein [Elusimicrobiota bacterium]
MKNSSVKLKLLQGLAGLILGVVLFYLAFRNVDWQNLKTSFRQMSAIFAVPACLVFFAGMILRGMRIAWLGDGGLKNLPFYFRSVIIALGINSFIPLRIGELVKILYLSRRAGLGILKAGLIIFTERLLDVLCLIILMGCAFSANRLLFRQWLATLPSGADRFQPWLKFGGIAFFCLTLICFFVLVFDIGRIRAKIAFYRQSLSVKILEIKSVFWGRFLKAFLLSLIIWSTDLVLLWSMSYGFRIPISFAQLIFLQVTLTLAYASSLSPGALGLYEFIGAWVMGNMGIGRSQALAFLVTTHGLIYFFMFAVTLIVFVQESRFILNLKKGNYSGRHSREGGNPGLDPRLRGGDEGKGPE